jgi:hypothetical protein
MRGACLKLEKNRDLFEKFHTKTQRAQRAQRRGKRVFVRKLSSGQKDELADKNPRRLFQVFMSEQDLCPIKFLVGQAGGMRGGKTFSGVPRRRDTEGGSESDSP